MTWVRSGSGSVISLCARRNRGGWLQPMWPLLFWHLHPRSLPPDLWTCGIPTWQTYRPRSLTFQMITARCSHTHPELLLVGFSRAWDLGQCQPISDWDNSPRSSATILGTSHFNVFTIPPPGSEPRDYVALPFIAAGAPDKARRMRLEIVPRLPAGAEIVLELSPEFAERLRVRPHSMPFAPLGSNDRPRVVHVPLNHCSRLSSLNCFRQRREFAASTVNIPVQC